MPRIPRFEQELEKIDSKAEELHLKTAYARASRGVWSGSGFGTTIRGTINATVKASVAAGIMNVGSGIAHGIGDSIVDSMNNSEIKSMGRKLFENPLTIKEFRQALYTACLDVGNVIIGIIEKHCDVRSDKLEGKIVFANEDLSKIDDRTLHAKFLNNLSAKKLEYAYALLIEKLRRCPVDQEILEGLFMLTIQRINFSNTDAVEIDTIERYAGDFGLDLTKLKNRIAEQLEKEDDK